MLGSRANWNTSQATTLALYLERTRLIETFTQTVTEVWVGNYMSKVIVTDTTQRFEARQRFASTHSMHEPLIREFTTSFTEVQREYPTSTRDALNVVAESIVSRQVNKSR